MRRVKASAKFIFGTIFIDALGIGLLIPVFPDVIRRFNADPAFVNSYFGYFIAVYAVMQFVASPVLGALSDRYGRRPVLLVSLLGAGLDYLLMAMAPNLWLLFLGRVISGLTGASMTVASSYMADVSDDSNRSANFGLIGAGWGLGFIAGPSLGGALGHFSPVAPFLAAAVLNLANFAFGYFVLPESLPPEQRRQVVLSKLNPLRSVFRVLKPSAAVLLIYVYFLLFLAGNVHPSVWTLYTEHRYHWTPIQVGMSLTLVGLCIAFVQGYLTARITPKLGVGRTLKTGMCFYVIGFFLFGIAPEGWMMYPILIVFCISGLAMPNLQAMISKGVPSNEQGELQGSLISLASLASILAPLLYTRLFSSFSLPSAGFYFPGMPYVTASFICVLSFALLLVHELRSSPS